MDPCSFLCTGRFLPDGGACSWAGAVRCSQSPFRILCLSGREQRGCARDLCLPGPHRGVGRRKGKTLEVGCRGNRAELVSQEVEQLACKDSEACKELEVCFRVV